MLSSDARKARSITTASEITGVQTFDQEKKEWIDVKKAEPIETIAEPIIESNPHVEKVNSFDNIADICDYIYSTFKRRIDRRRFKTLDVVVEEALRIIND